MATFTFGREIDIRWNGYDIKGPAGTVFSIPDQLYEEFDSDIAPVEPTLVWIDTNEFLTLQNSVSVTTLTGTSPIVITETSAGRDISLSANYQTAGTYVTSITGTAPITASGTTAITVGIDQTAITAGNASSAQATVYLVRNNTASTILKGTLVSATGAEPSGRIDIAPFSVTGLQDSELRVMGIATENIGVGVNGIVMSFGTLTGLDTRGTAASALAVGDEDWDEGTILYAHPTVPGKLTEVRPQHDLAIAFTTVRHGSTGQIAIRIVPGNFHLEWLHDVSADNPSDGDIIQYKTSSSLWTKDSISGAGIAASVHTHAYQDAGTYVTAVNGTAPITASTDTAGIVTVGLSASYQTAGTYITAVNGSAPIATSTDTAGIVSVSLSASYASDIHTHHTSSITTGDFAATVSGGTGVTVTGGTGNASTPTVSIGQAVATTSNVTFANITGTGMFSAPNIARGRVSITPVANETTGVAVTGLTVKTSAVTATSDDVSVLVTGESSANAFRTSSASSPTFSGSNLTGFTVNVFRTNTTTMSVWWLAVGS